MSPRHQEGIAHLLYGINMGGGFVALTGEVGTGKTTLCYFLLQQVPDDVDIAYILNPKLNSVELLASIGDELGISYPKNCSSVKVLNDLLNEHLLNTHARGRRTVLIIDEAQNLDFDVLEQIRLLTNLETSTAKLLQIILIGQPELKELLHDKRLRQLNQRITARYHLKPLSLKETRTYIEHRMKVSGGFQGIFKASTIKQIYKLTHGVPRLINLLCDRSLLGAYGTGSLSVNNAIINKAAKEVLPEQPKKSYFIPVILSVFLLLFLSLIPATSYFNFPLKELNYGFKDPVIISKTVDKKKSALSNDEVIARTEVPVTKSASLSEPKQSAAIAATPKKRPSFADFIGTTSLSMENALTTALHQWDIETPENFTAECLFVQKSGLRCLPGKSDWQQLINLKRQVIMEFELENSQKRFALLVGVTRKKAIFRSDQEYIFPISEVLKYWNGYFLVLWKPPASDFWTLAPGQKSGNILWLRQQLDKIQGKKENRMQPDFYDMELEKRVKQFQHQRKITQDGLVGPLTVIHLQNTMSSGDFPQLR
jgi:general secretion pathway protein A